jgi:Spy/CpxP family protein refolding chaperone
MFNKTWRVILWVLVCAVFAGAVVVRADSTTQPSQTGGTGELRPGPALVIQRFKTIIGQLDLTDDERMQIDAFFSQANQEGLDLSQSLGTADFGQRFKLLSQFTQKLRGQLAQILTDDQMATVDKKLAALPSRRPGGFSGATTRPGGGGAGNGGQGRGMAMLQAMRQALSKLDLTDDQKQEVQDLLKSVQQQLTALREKAQSGENIQQDLAQIRQDVRDKLQTILTDDQMQAFQQALQQARQNYGTRGGGGDGPGDLKAEKPADLDFSGPEVGSAVPQIPIEEANGHTFWPNKYKGRVLVLEFGSMSCPVFREHAADMERLKAAEGGRAFFLIVYTKEEFPAGDKNAERNKEEGVSVMDAASLDDRISEALETQRELRITISMAVDSMDDSVSKAFGGFPNGAVVIGKDGTIAAHQQWTNPDTLKEAIDDAVAAPQVASN